MANETSNYTNDGVTNRVIEKIISRQQVGFKKYGVTLQRPDLTLPEWLNHLQEELMDATQYIEKLKDEHEDYHVLHLIADLAAQQEMSGYRHERSEVLRELLAKIGKL